MPNDSPGISLTGHPHITMAVGKVQEDLDFHTKVLGYNVPTREQQDRIKNFIEGLGYTDLANLCASVGRSFLLNFLSRTECR